MTAGAAHPSQDPGPALDAAIDRALAEARIVGCVCLVAKSGRRIYQRAAGWADREANRTMRQDAVFRLASVTKPFTVVAVMRLVEQGLLDLDSPVTTWLPDFRPRLADGSQPQISLRQLLCHTAGLSYAFAETSEGPYRRARISTGLDDIDSTLDEVVGLLSRAPLLFPPGTGWSYGMGHDVAGAIVARVMGVSFDVALRRLVTDPLDLGGVAFAPDRRVELVTPYADGPAGPVRMSDPHVADFNGAPAVFSPGRPHRSGAFPSGGAGLVGTASDVLALLEVIRDGAGLLSAASVADLHRLEVGASAMTQGPGWGFALGGASLVEPSLAATPQRAGVLQWGGFYGHNWFVDADAELTVVTLTNTAFEGMWGQLPRDVRNACYGAG